MENQTMSICLWFDRQAKEAAEFYCSVFKNSEIKEINYFGQEGFDKHGQPEGSVLTVSFRLNDMNFIALNGGPHFKFNESISLVLNCQSDEEVDYFWDALCSGGGQESFCGWLKDKYGVSWQVVPIELQQMLKDPVRSGPITEAFLKMRKLDMNVLRKVWENH